MRGELLVSTAEGFFFLSGIILGIVRGIKIVDKPFDHVVHLVLKRALQLYITYFVLVIAFTLLAWYVYPGNPNIKYGVMETHSWLKLAWETLTLQYTYGWADYLRFYAVFLAVSPLALWLLRKNMWYFVLLLSFAVWFISPIDIHTMEWTSIQIYQPIPWQLLFFSGLVVGFHWPDISSWWEKRKKLLTRAVAIPLITLAAGLFIWNVFAVFAQEFVQNQWTQMLSSEAWRLRMNEFHKEQLTFERFALFMLWFWAAFMLIERFKGFMVKWTGWLLLPFGMNSLYVYTLHAVLVYFVHIYFKDTTLLVNFVITSGVIAIIYLAIRTRFLMSVIPR